MAVDERKIAVLGAGQIGGALIGGLLSSGWRTPAELAASARREERAAELRERHGIEVTLSNPYTFRATALSNLTGLLAAIALFALGLSVVIASFLLTFIGGYASPRVRFVEMLAAAAILAFVTIAIFVWGIGLPIPVWPDL